MKKYKVGDKVKIKKNAPGANNDYPYVFSSTMRGEFGGHIMTIKKIEEKFAAGTTKSCKFYNGDDCAYYMEEDHQVYTWHSSMFDEDDIIEDIIMAEFEIKKTNRCLPCNIPCIVFSRHNVFARRGTITKVDDADFSQSYEVDHSWIDSYQQVMPDFKELLNRYESILYESDILGVVTITKSDNPDYPLNVKLEDEDELELTEDGKMFKNSLRPILL